MQDLCAAIYDGNDDDGDDGDGVSGIIDKCGGDRRDDDASLQRLVCQARAAALQNEQNFDTFASACTRPSRLRRRWFRLAVAAGVAGVVAVSLLKRRDDIGDWCRGRATDAG
jgi:hypothetical protein